MLNKIALILVIIGGLNWGLVGAVDFNLVSRIFGEGSMIGNIVYILVGLSALVLIFVGKKSPAPSQMSPRQ